ncbi:hypothetical protein C8C83_1599 [Flavobacterium sp. 90]|uniref:hypothetical protein n=1 Tax=unclassified Flavobacterium TaxID=196869 RepID=UPI000F12ECCF|nr:MULTISPECIES: hypothetical protein [unclassified Flavobacterium]RKR09938.1 hypothetical protein C8C82_1901 [Flavobacterium sp. 81]TCK53723.1 hypothetical protein C8C83_1599 [Flavobacterium sp. 90]
MRRITKMFKSLLLLSLVLLMTNCATEEIGQKNVAQSSSEAKIWFDSHQKDYNATVLNYIGSLQWQNAIISKGEDGEIIEVPFNLSSNLSATTKEADQYNDHHRLMFIKDEQNGFKLYYIQILTNDENYKIQDKNYNYYNIKDTFNGKIFVQELATNAGTKIEFKKGKKIEPSLTTKYSENEIQCVYYGYWYEDGHFEPLYEVGCYASGGSDPQYLPAPDYGGGTGSSGSENTDQTIAQKIEKNINSDQLKGCPKDVLEKLKNATNCDIATILAKLGSTRTINLEIITKQPTNGQPAQTVRTNSLDRYQYTVRISPDYTSATSLFRASNILHEFTHAYFMSLIDDYASTSNPIVFADTPTLFQAFCDSKFPPKKSELPNLHHKEMAETYVKAIGAALQEFQTGIPVIAGKAPNQIYTDLAWGGLRGTPIYDETFPVGSEDYKRIEDRYAAESNGGTSGNQTAIGKPCKI